MVNSAEHRVDKLDEALATLSQEVAAYVRESRADTATLKNEMAEFKNEMAEFKNETRRDARMLNQRLGEIAASQGKLVEDIAAPSVPRVLRTLLGLPEQEALEFFAIRLKLAHPVRRGEHAELDVVAAHGETALIVEAKVHLTPEGITTFARSLPRVREFLPQFAGFGLMGAVAAVFVDTSLVTYGERLGLIVLAAGDDLLSIQNAQGFSPRRF